VSADNPRVAAERGFADSVFGRFKAAFGEMLVDRQKRREGEILPAFEAMQTQSAGVHDLILRWIDGDISRNVEGMLRVSSGEEWKLGIYIHAWRNTHPTRDKEKDALPPKRITTMSPDADKQVLKNVLNEAYEEVLKLR